MDITTLYMASRFASSCSSHLVVLFARIFHIFFCVGVASPPDLVEQRLPLFPASDFSIQLHHSCILSMYTVVVSLMPSGTDLGRS